MAEAKASVMLLMLTLSFAHCSVNSLIDSGKSLPVISFGICNSVSARNEVRHSRQVPHFAVKDGYTDCINVPKSNQKVFKCLSAPVVRLRLEDEKSKVWRMLGRVKSDGTGWAEYILVPQFIN
jgi:hypothetical protein